MAAQGGWLNPDAPDRFAAQCERVMRAMGDGISHVVTFNEPNIFRLLDGLLPPQVRELERATLDQAARVTGAAKFVASNVVRPEDGDALERGLLKGHAMARQAIKAVRSNVPVGCSLALVDEQAVAGGEAMRDKTRARLYGPWLASARNDDFLGVQNYERRIWGASGRIDAPADALRSQTGQEVFAPSLAGAVRYAHAATGVPIFVTEHGVSSEDDRVRAALIPDALGHLHALMAQGVPVLGYCHWSLIDNFEWIFGYGPKFGLHSLDRKTFVRTPKPSSRIYGAIARANAV
jgi:beta-glucosidase